MGAEHYDAASDEAVEAQQQPLAEHDRAAQPVDAEEPPRLAFTVVGIGASAGGLEAVIDFLSATPADSGLAYVLVQHLPPERESLMPEILSKKTDMPVKQIEDGMAVEPNHVYTIRPGRTLTLKNGKLWLGENLNKPMHSRPVDDFLRSLAEEQRERAVAVIMSGMGSNGTAGAQAVKAVGGLCIAQDPESAVFPSMPRHLIDAGYADYILRPADMPEMLMAYAGHPYARDRGGPSEAMLQREQQHIREILAVLRMRTRHDFTGYKKPTVLRRIQRRMGLARVTKLSHYARMLRQTPSEASALADDLLIHVTGFFRDPEAWETLRERVIVPMVRSREPDASVRAWVSACASGEEAYTLAMLLTEESERAEKNLDVKVFATDTAEVTLKNARQGVYPGGIETEVSPARLERFFQKEDAVYRVRPDLRECVVFAPQDLLHDPPFSRLDIITCRNLLIYLEPDLQQRVLALLHFGLRDGGMLFLGTSETVGNSEEMFECVDKKARIFRRVGPTRQGSVEFPIPRSFGQTADAAAVEPRFPLPKPTVAQLTTRTLLDHHTPAALTVDKDLRVVYFHGKTAPFLQQPSGEPTRDLFALVRDTVRGAVRSAVHKAMAQGTTATVHDGTLEDSLGQNRHVMVTASPAGGRTDAGFMVVSFRLVELTPTKSQETEEGTAEESNAHLRYIRDELQSTNEALQTSNEELKAAHEELVSTNEELQSTNEELETSREEMQSLNEELSTVNAQLQAKMEEFQTVNDDLSSLFASTDIAVLFLDTRFHIRRFTPQVRELLDVIATDIGRPLSDLARKFDDPTLMKECAQVLERLVPTEREISADGGRWFMRRLNPYRTADNRIDGVVVAFVETTARRRVEDALRKSEEQFRKSIEQAPIPVIMQAENGEVLQVSNAWVEGTGYKADDPGLAEAWLTMVSPSDASTIRYRLRELFRANVRAFTADFRIRTKSGEERHWSFSASSPGALRDGRRIVVGMALDITDRIRAQKELEGSKRTLEAASAMKDQFLANISHELRTPLSVILMWSKLLSTTTMPQAQQREAIEAIGRSAHAQRRLIDDLLDMTRISCGKLRVNPKSMDINAVTRAAFEVVRPLADAKGLRLSVEIPKGVQNIIADSGRIEQVLWILLSNAVKFTPPGGSITVQVRSDGELVAIVVQDTGRGIEADFLPKMFHPFSQGEEAGVARVGLGLGLSIAKSIVELHGGTFTAASAGPDKGATFAVHLLKSMLPLEPAGESGGTSHLGELVGMEVLLAEDNPDALRSFQVTLERAGAAVTGVSNARDGINAFMAMSPNLLISDVSMPEMNGLEMVRKLRAAEANQGFARVPMVALTALATVKDRTEAIAAGFDDFIAKPVDPDTFLAKLAEVVRRAHGR